MKKKQLILFLALLAATLGLRAQDSIRHYASYFGENATEWKVGWCGNHHIRNAKYWIAGDTVIGDYAYKKVYSEVNGFSNRDDYEEDTPMWMREDTLTGRLWIRQALNNDTSFREVLVCDMHLEVGESITLIGYYMGSESSFSAMVVDVNEHNGLRWLTLINPNYDYDIFFAEGVGSICMFDPTLFGSRHAMSETYTMLGCMFKDDTLAFTIPDIESYNIQDCEFVNVRINPAEDEVATLLYPNPCRERLQIANLPEGVQSLYITDMLGRCVYGTAQPAESIPTTQLPQGVYRLTMVMNDNQHYSLTFVKR